MADILKVRGKEYTLKHGDYILDNGCCLQTNVSKSYVSKKDFEAFKKLPLVKKESSCSQDIKNFLNYYVYKSDPVKIKEEQITKVIGIVIKISKQVLSRQIKLDDYKKQLKKANLTIIRLCNEKDKLEAKKLG